MTEIPWKLQKIADDGMGFCHGFSGAESSFFKKTNYF